MRIKYSIVLIALILINTGCVSFYEKNIRFHHAVSEGNYSDAEKELKGKWEKEKHRNHLLYLLNMGWIKWLQNQPEESNKYFTQADDYIELQRKNVGAEALAMVSNPKVKPYIAEDYEVVLINYYKSLNYLNMSDYEGALVEARKMSEKLYALNDKYKATKAKFRYSDDAFSHVMMGMIYEANGEYNDAYIAYKNAIDVYDSIYVRNFNESAPLQLKKDLLRTAYKTGFFDDVRFFERKFNMQYTPEDNRDEGTLIFIWNNGLCPIKEENSINFVQGPNKNGIATFTDEATGLSFPVFFGNYSSSQQSKFSNIKAVRVAFPKFVKRPPLYIAANIRFNNVDYPLQLSENISTIAVENLSDRMYREIGAAILRLLVKQSMEEVARSQNNDLGSLISIVNAVTEQADTRNWQTLPGEIFYTRIPLPAGEQEITFTTFGKNTTEHTIKVNIKKGNTTFYTFSNFQLMNPPEIK